MSAMSNDMAFFLASTRLALRVRYWNSLSISIVTTGDMMAAASAIQAGQSDSSSFNLFTPFPVVIIPQEKGTHTRQGDAREKAR